MAAEAVQFIRERGGEKLIKEKFAILRQIKVKAERPLKAHELERI